MSRKTNYGSKLYTDETKALDADVIKKKIGNSEIDAAELAAFLSKYSRRRQTQDPKTIRRKITEICKKSKGLLKESDFKKIINGNEKYVFKPEYHGFIIPLIDSIYLLKKPNKRTLNVRNRLLEDLLINIETYMSKEDLDILKTNPAYCNAKLERLFSGAINKQLSRFVREVYHADEIVRHQEMKYALETLIELNNKLARKNVHIEATKMVYGNIYNDSEGGEYLKALMQAHTIGDFIVYLLALKVSGKKYEFLNEDEKLSYEALWAASKVYEDDIEPSSMVGQKLIEIDSIAANNPKIKKIIEKAQMVFDLNDPFETYIYNSIVRQAMACYVASDISEKDYEQTVRFIESNIAFTKWDLLEKFRNEKEWDSPILQEFRRIESLRGLFVSSDNLEK